MIAWNYIVGIVAVALLVFLLWKERRRADRSRLGWRMAASVLAVAGLAGLVLPLSYHRAVKATAGEEGIYLTEGYDPDSVRQFLAAHPGVHELWGDPAATGGAVPQAPMGWAGTEWPVDRLHVFGYGLRGQQWAALRAPKLIIHASPRGVGFVAVDWQRRLLTGEPLQVQGCWQRTEGERDSAEGNDRRSRPVKLLLVGLGGVLDSAVVDADGKFSLSAVPAQRGKAVYRLVALAGTAGAPPPGGGMGNGGAGAGRADTLEQESIPIQVGPGRALKILILAATPDFENTFLVNWLAKNGQQVASRTAVSRNNYQSSFVNMGSRLLYPLTPSLLGDFDVVIADASALPAAGEAGLPVLRRQVEEKGLGLIIKVDSAGPAGVGIGGAGQAQIGKAGDSLEPPYVRERPGMRSLVRDSFSRMAVGGSLYGAGKVVFTTLNTTYARVLAGQPAFYAAYWSALLRRVAPQVEAGEEWQWEPALPRVQEPVVEAVQTNGVQPQGVIGGGEGSPGIGEATSLYLAQDEMLSFYYRGIYWPEAEGWMTLSTLQGDTTWSYVWPRTAWATFYREQRRRETMNFLAREGARTSRQVAPEPEQVAREAVAIPKYWFYIVFLISILFLWVERKMGGMSGPIIQ
jgi:hypothetical protein